MAALKSGKPSESILDIAARTLPLRSNRAGWIHGLVEEG